MRTEAHPRRLHSPRGCQLECAVARSRRLSYRRCACIEHVRRELRVSERGACAALGQHRSTQRKMPQGRDDEERLTADIVELARQYGRYGYRKIAALLRDVGWLVNNKRVERIWRREGLKVPKSSRSAAAFG